MLSFDWKYPALGFVGKVTRYAISPNWTKPSAAAGMKKQPNRQQQHHHDVTSRERCTPPEKESKFSRISRRVKKIADFLLKPENNEAEEISGL